MVSQFRLISLCNVLYEGLSKLLVNRLKPLMDCLVSPYQTSFVLKRSIHDNIIIAKEIVHTMSRLHGRRGFMIIKIDLEKVYDRMEWNFIGNVFEQIGFDENLRRVVRVCVSSSTMSLMWNGGKIDSFAPSRGLRQGDPLSPYLIVLGIEIDISYDGLC